MRLIDADELMCKILKEPSKTSNYRRVIEIIRAQPTACDVEKALVCNCIGCKHNKTDECMHCMRAYSDCYESI